MESLSLISRMSICLIISILSVEFYCFKLFKVWQLLGTAPGLLPLRSKMSSKMTT